MPHIELTDMQVKMNLASSKDIEQFLINHSNDFNPPFDCEVKISEYAQKLRKYGNTYELWFEGHLDAILVVYLSEKLQQIYIPYICTKKSHYGPHVGQYLFKMILHFAHPFRYIRLEVNKNNLRAFSFYKKLGFKKIEENKSKIKMELQLKNEHFVDSVISENNQ